MRDGFLPVIGGALEHGPWVAGLCAFAVTPGILAVIARVVERRWLVPGRDFASVVYGDPLLAVAVALGVSVTGSTRPSGLTGTSVGLAVLLFWSLFGLYQWWDELHRGYFTRAQALAPTKIWHQLVIYPVLGYWTWTACMDGLFAPPDGVWPDVGRAVMMASVLGWVATNVYDRLHPKLGHPPFDWRRVRPYSLPWPGRSLTIDAATLNPRRT